MSYYIHKYQVALQYGGPEGGGWWYESGEPTGFTFGPLDTDENTVYSQCARLNDLEYERANKHEIYPYSSVLAHHSTHYAYGVSTDPQPTSLPHRKTPL